MHPAFLSSNRIVWMKLHSIMFTSWTVEIEAHMCLTTSDVCWPYQLQNKRVSNVYGERQLCMPHYYRITSLCSPQKLFMLFCKAPNLESLLTIFLYTYVWCDWLEFSKIALNNIWCTTKWYPKVFHRIATLVFVLTSGAIVPRLLLVFILLFMDKWTQ